MKPLVLGSTFIISAILPVCRAFAAPESANFPSEGIHTIHVLVSNSGLTFINIKLFINLTTNQSEFKEIENYFKSALGFY